ncbi:MAG TPA: pyruvate dehydrogenase [Armatimonadetes bacterium]|nr:pyruvate dehydrogenase [Armatimonadota bacterium]
MSYPVEELREHYRMMWLIREFEQALSEQFSAGAIGGTSHFCIGQEACAVGAVAGLRGDDLMTSNHRGHGHFLAKGADPGRLMAELMGKADGYSAGRGGSQHMADFSIGFLGSNGITGGMIPVATGAALSQRLLGTGRVVLCMFGDGACAQGAFHEGINMGAIWRLPIVYFIENNLYAMSTPARQNFNLERLSGFADAYGIAGASVDGNDYFAVRDATARAAEGARAGAGPTIIEALTYRQCGHSKSDVCEYRSDEEEQRWAERDPLGSMRTRLLADGVVDSAGADELEREARAAVERAVDFARSSPAPSVATAATGVFSDVG